MSSVGSENEFSQSYLYSFCKPLAILDINVLNFNEMLTNDIVSFEQPAPVQSESSLDAEKIFFRRHPSIHSTYFGY